MDNGFKQAIKYSGSGAGLARLINITKNAVYAWKGLIPFAWLERVALVTGLPIYSLHPVLREAEQKIRADERQRLFDAGRLLVVEGENTEL
ncbi:MAG: hypothetical protein COB24_08990 [Hyphomicrobiales bacterium]|nr:MAG: hypothetical protein COB24_08990 [Hyphomicrobiales bacterium]